jgi:uncharacterized protein (DUF2249 family)
MAATYVDVDVRPILRDGGEPFEKIMEAVNALRPGQGLRLFATFQPVPLLQVLGSRGFAHEMKEIGGGDWEVLFHPQGSAAAAAPQAVPPPADDTPWPAPIHHMDNRDLDPPEPMVRILAAVETMAPGEVLSALLCREPVFLLPELAKRGHRWRGGFEGADYKILIRVGGANEADA